MDDDLKMFIALLIFNAFSMLMFTLMDIFGKGT